MLFLIFLRRFFIFVKMGPYVNENFKTLQIASETFQTFLNFLTKGPHKTAFRIFEILKIEI